MKDRTDPEQRAQLERLRHDKDAAETVSHLEHDKRPLPYPPPVGEHIETAMAVRRENLQNLEHEKSRLRSVVLPGSAVDGRAKEVRSTVEKLQRKPEYETVDRFQDNTGLRVICKDISEVERNVAAVKSEFERSKPLVTAKGTKDVEDNYIHKDKDGYRSHHLIVRSRAGSDMEIQIRTERQHQFAQWSHKMYKESDPWRMKNIVKAPETKLYQKRISRWLYEQDMGRPVGAPPEPPPAVAEYYKTPMDFPKR